MSTSSSPAIIPKVALTLTGEIANKEKEKTKTTQAPYLVLSECLSQPQGVRPIFVPKSMKVVVPNPAPMAVAPVLQPKSITFPNPVTDLARAMVRSDWKRVFMRRRGWGIAYWHSQ